MNENNIYMDWIKGFIFKFRKEKVTKYNGRYSRHKVISRRIKFSMILWTTSIVATLAQSYYKYDSPPPFFFLGKRNQFLNCGRLCKISTNIIWYLNKKHLFTLWVLLLSLLAGMKLYSPKLSLEKMLNLGDSNSAAALFSWY